MADSNQIYSLRRTPERQQRIKGSADRRSRPKIATDVQVSRLGGAMARTFSSILDRDDIDVAKDPSALAPERALVLEIIGQPSTFVKAAAKAGLEWLAEEVATLHGVTEYFEASGARDDEDEDGTSVDEYEDLLGGDLDDSGQDASDEGTDGRLYLGMPTIASFDRLRTLWDTYASGAKAPEGDGVWWDLFSHLHRIRTWEAADRVSDATRMRLRAERARQPDEEVRIEVDLWYRGDPRRREEVNEAFRATVRGIGGTILDELRIDDIRYHSALVRLPSDAVDAILARAGPLAIADEVMSIRPQSSFRFAVDEHHPEAAQQTEDAPGPPLGASIAAMIDGWPVENHTLLRDRLDVIPLDVADSLAPVNKRFHGTAMASLILRGDEHYGFPPISRRLKIVPVLAPDDAGYESPPLDKLPLGLIHRAVRDLKEGTDGQPPSGPDVLIINHSICDEAFGFTGSISPWARLLDHLSWKYKVLFVVSAGNIRESFDLPDYPNAAAMRAATADHRRTAVLKAIDAAKSQRTMFAPAESVNALTVAASHSDGSAAVLPASLSDPFVSFSAPNLSSGLGLGFGRSVKPDVMLPGGRQIAHPTMSGMLRVRGHEAPAYFGQKVASPDPDTGDVSMVRRSSGTSNAAALATRAGLLIGDVLDVSLPPTRETGPWYGRPAAACVLKALIAHGASWGEVGAAMTDVHVPGMSKVRAKETVSRAIGYGQVDHDRIVAGDRSRVTLLGQDLIKKDQRHEWRVPLPYDLSSSAEFRRIVVTLAWLTPIRASSTNYRMIGLELVGSDGRSGIWEGASRASHQPSIKSSQRGTLIHAVYEGRKAVPFGEDGDFVLNVQATSKLTHVLGYDIPYALAVTIEVADTISADIRDSIRRRVGDQVRSTT